MKIHIDKHILMNDLDQVSKALPSKSAYEIMTGILFKADHVDGLTLIAGDGFISLKAEIDADDFQLERAGSIVLPGTRIVEIVKRATDDIMIDVNGTQVVVKSGKSKFNLTGINAEDYPIFTELSEGDETIKMKGEQFNTLIKKTIFACSTEEKTPILTGVLFELHEGNIKLISTDRHRLVRINHSIEDSDLNLSLVIWSENLKKMVKVIDDKNDVSLSISPNGVSVKTKRFTIYSRLLEGGFPLVDKMIPIDFSTVVTVNRKSLLDALDQVMIIAKEEKTKHANLIIGEDIEINSQPKDASKAEAFIEFTGLQGDPFKISLNIGFLEEALKALNEEEITINYLKPFSPIIIKGVGNDNELHLILPYRTAKEA